MQITQKQVMYPKLTSRVMSTMLDMILVILICSPIQSFISKILLKMAIADYPEITIENIQTIITPERIEGDYKLKNSLITYAIELFVAQFVLLGAYYVVFWNYFGYTPGKYFFRMRIVDLDTMEQPKFFKFILRFIGYLFAPLNIIFMLLDRRGRGLHDRMAKTVVIVQ